MVEKQFQSSSHQAGDRRLAVTIRRTHERAGCTLYKREPGPVESAGHSLHSKQLDHRLIHHTAGRRGTYKGVLFFNAQSKQNPITDLAMCYSSAFKVDHQKVTSIAFYLK